MAAKATDFEFNRQDLEDLLKRRFFLSRAFDIYGGVAGLYDLGVSPLFIFELIYSPLDAHCKLTSLTHGVVISF